MVGFSQGAYLKAIVQTDEVIFIFPWFLGNADLSNE